MDMLILNGVTVKNPDIYEITPNDLQSEATGRSQSGDMFIERIRADIPTIKLGWSLIKASDCKIILNVITPVSFNISYFDLGEIVTKNVYRGNRSRTLIRADENSPNSSLYSMTLELVEM